MLLGVERRLILFIEGGVEDGKIQTPDGKTKVHAEAVLGKKFQLFLVGYFGVVVYNFLLS